MQNLNAKQQKVEQANAPLSQKKLYHTPELIVHGRVSKLTLQTGGGIPGEGVAGLNVF